MQGPAFTTADIQRYYDRNTPAFLRLGQGGGALHRAVWGPGVESRDQAFAYVHELLAQRIRRLAGNPPKVVDLGCGVGATLCDLAERVPFFGTGVTISGVQAQIARHRIAQLGLADRLSCVEGDFTALPASIGPAHMAYAIESFAHALSAADFFREAARVIAAGGLLTLCDDVRSQSADARASKVWQQFTHGWHINSLLTVHEIQEMAKAAGFAAEETIDLTPYLELGRPRDRAIDVMARALGWMRWTRLAPLIGGAALQEGLRRGWIAYQFMVFRRG